MKIPAQRCNLPENDKEWCLEQIGKLFDNGMFAYGEWVNRFEKLLGEHLKRKYVVAMSGCGPALEVACRALGAELVVVPSNTFAATPMAIEHADGSALFCDSGQDGNVTYRDVIDTIRQCGGPGNIDGVMPVYIGGNIPREIKIIAEYCEQNDISLVIDAAHCNGTTDSAKYGDAVCYSTYATKVLTTGTEGGFLATDDKDIYDYARAFRDYGRTPEAPLVNFQEGHNFSMSEISAIIGVSQLTRLHEYVRNRRRIAEIYAEKFKVIGDFNKSNFYKVIIMDKVKVSDNIKMAGKVYDVPCHLQPYFNRGVSYVNAERFSKQHSCLPIYNNMTEEEVRYVMANVGVKG